VQIKNLEINEIIPYQNDRYVGIKILWNANIGFGECDLYRNVGSETWNADTEHMCDNKDREFMKMLMDKLVEKVEVVG